MEPKIVTGDAGYVLDDVPHFNDFLTDLHTCINPLKENPSYSVVKEHFVNDDDTIMQKAVQHKDGERGNHFRRHGPRQKIYFVPEEVTACIVTCGGLCPGLNTVIREIVCGLDYMYGVKRILGIEGGYKGFYSKNTITLTPKSVDHIHKQGGTILGTSRGGYVTSKIVDSIQDRGINHVYIIGGDGTQKGAAIIYQETRKRGLKCSVVGIPKTIDNDIPVIDKSFGFDTAVEEAQRAINAAHVEAESAENGIGLVKLMGRDSGFIAMFATLASRDVDCCLIPESPFYLEGPGGLYEFIEKRLRENGHMVIVIAEGAGEKLEDRDASGNTAFKDVGLWMSHMIKVYFASPGKIRITLKYIDPTYMIRAVPANASDNVYCTVLAESAVHGAMAGYTGFTVGPVNSRQCYIPFYRITEQKNKVVITDRMWARLLSSTNQPSFMNPKDVIAQKPEEPKSSSFMNPKDVIAQKPEEPKSSSFMNPKDVIAQKPEEPKSSSFMNPKDVIAQKPEEPKSSSFMNPKDVIAQKPEEPKSSSFMNPKDVIAQKPEEPKSSSFMNPKDVIAQKPEEPKSSSFMNPKDVIVQEPEEPKSSSVMNPKDVIVQEPEDPKSSSVPENQSASLSPTSSFIEK